MADWIVVEIEEAKATLSLSELELRLLDEDEARPIFLRAEAHFVATSGRTWWWEDFRSEGVSHHFVKGNGFLYLIRIVPSSSEIVYWIVEDSHFRPYYRIYEGTVETIQRIIGKCYGFEYTLIAKDLRWLICEMHHDVLIAIGEEVEENLRDFLTDTHRAGR